MIAASRAVCCFPVVMLFVGWACLAGVAQALTYDEESACQRYNRSDSVFIGEVAATTPPGNPWEIWQPIYNEMAAKQCGALRESPQEFRECDERVWALAYQETWRQIVPNEGPPAFSELMRNAPSIGGFRKRDYLRQQVRIKVIELFKGEDRPEATIAQWVSREGRSNLRPGEKYLFHLDRKPSGDELHFHGALLPDSPDAIEELELIEAIQTSANSTVLTGKIGIDATKLESPLPGVPAGWMGYLEGATVRIASQNFNTTVESGPGGAYLVRNPSPGEYTVNAEFPPGNLRSSPKTVKVSVGACVEARFLLKVEQRNPTRIEGRLLNADGSPHPGPFIEVAPIGEPVNRTGQRRVLNIDGTFEFIRLAEGQYVLGIGLGKAPSATSRHTGYHYPYVKFYYPGVAEISQAIPVDVKADETAGPFEWNGPAPLDTREIEGVVRWNGGEPAGWIQVDLIDTEFDEVVDRMASRPDGTFRMFGLQGRAYKLKLQSMPASGFSSVQAEVDLNREVRAPLQLVLEPGN